MSIEDTIKKEGNRKEFTYKGYNCLIKRTERGILCGYVGLPKGHKYYGQHYRKIPIRAHGSLTYADHWTSENNDLWYIGFDCGHSFDVVPYYSDIINDYVGMVTGFNSQEDLTAFTDGIIGIAETGEGIEKEYRTMKFVTEECKRIVDQLIDEHRI